MQWNPITPGITSQTPQPPVQWFDPVVLPADLALYNRTFGSFGYFIGCRWDGVAAAGASPPGGESQGRRRLMTLTVSAAELDPGDRLAEQGARIGGPAAH